MQVNEDSRAAGWDDQPMLLLEKDSFLKGMTSLLQVLNQGVLWLDASGGIILDNPAVRRLLRSGNLTGRNIRDFAAAGSWSAPVWQKIIDTMVFAPDPDEAGKPRESEVLVLSEGEELTVLRIKFCYCGGGQGAVVLVVIDDISAIKQLNNSMAASWKLTVISKELLRTAQKARDHLRSTRGLGKVLESQVEEMAGRGAVKPLLTEVDRLGQLVDRIVEIAGSFLPLSDVVRLKQLVTETMLMYKAESLARGVALIDCVPEGVPPIRGHEHQLKIVFNILVGQAIYLCSSGGKVILNASAWPLGSMVECMLKVSAPVLSSNDQSEIRSTFPLLDTKNQGFDQGVFLARQVVEEHGGRLLVDTGPGRDLVISVLLPMACSEG